MRKRKSEELKDSGIEWLGKLPNDWKLVRMRYLSRIDTGDKDTQDSVDAGEYPFFVRSENVENLDSYSFDTEAVMTSGDGAGVCKIYHHYEGKFALHQRMYAIYNFKNVIGRYIYYSMRANFEKEVFKLSAKSTVDSLRMPMLKNFPLALPSLKEQKAIATFLDHKTQAIDQLIKKKQQLIEKLNEKRQALITQAVTKGLNPDAPMKDSGIEWLGEIPEHWEVIKYRHITKRIDVGIAEAATHAYSDTGVPIIRSTNVKQNYIDQSDLYHITVEFADKNSSKYLYKDDLVTVRTGNAGITAVVPENLHKSQCFTLLVTTPNHRMISKFLSYFINCTVGVYQFSLKAWGTAQKNISVPIMGDLDIPVPTTEEQKDIVDHIDESLDRNNSVIDILSKQINKLKEYRQSLISAAVTGKIDVRSSMIEATTEMDDEVAS